MSRPARRIAFLACADTLPGAPGRREDAFEHDLMVGALRPAIEARGAELVEIDWAAPLGDFAGCDAALLGTAWDYQDRLADFLARLDALEAAGVRVFNPPALVRWNGDKAYLRDLAAGGAITVPTLWHEDAGAAEIAEALDHFAADRVVVKRRVGAGALGQHSFARDSLPAPGWRMGHPCMIQPFLPAIASEGEYTLFFVDGAFSHAVRKTPAPGEYRIQSLYGGIEHDHAPGAADIAAAAGVLAALPFAAPLYGRIDMVRLPGGALAVMEAEMIEPYYYPQQGPLVGERLAEALLARI